MSDLGDHIMQVSTFKVETLKKEDQVSERRRHMSMSYCLQRKKNPELVSGSRFPDSNSSVCGSGTRKRKKGAVESLKS